jgi:hypothetical protein
MGERENYDKDANSATSRKKETPITIMNPTKDLYELGFREVGQWSLDNNLKSAVRFTLTTYSDDRVIYAFMVDDDLKYIGVCDKTATTLSDRMSRYQSMAGAGTNKRVTGLIRKALSTGSRVKILASKPDKGIKISPLEVDLVKGLENPLIQEFKPEWNIHG